MPAYFARTDRSTELARSFDRAAAQADELTADIDLAMNLSSAVSDARRSAAEIATALRRAARFVRHQSERIDTLGIDVGGPERRSPENREPPAPAAS